MAAALAHLRTHYGVDTLTAGWAKQRPDRVPAGTAPEHYARARQAQFRAYFTGAVAALPPELRHACDTRWAVRRSTELAAYQAQLTILMTLDPQSYQDVRMPLPLHQAAVALVIGGRSYCIDACACDAHGDLLIFPRDGAADSPGSALPLRGAANGALQDVHGRSVPIDQRGQVTIGTLPVGVLRPPSLAVIKRHVAAIVSHAGGAGQGGPPDPSTAPDLLLAQARRAAQGALRALRDAPTQAALQALRRAPILINGDAHDGTQPLTVIRQTHRGIGDHALTVIRTDRSMVFDLSHISFDGGWGMAVAEIMTNQARDLAPVLAQLAVAPAAGLAPLAITANPTFVQAARTAAAHRTVEAAAETRQIDLAAITHLRRRLARRQLPLTVNDLLVLARLAYATSYQPGAPAQHALAVIATLPDGPALAQGILAHLAEQRTINPALLIPMDASAVDPQLRLYPATFRNPLRELLGRLDQCNTLVSRLQRQHDGADQAAFAAARSALVAELDHFGATLQALKQVTMRGESFSTAALRLLGHLPQPVQYLMDLIPQKIDIRNELLKGREVCSNVGHVAPGATLTRFASARDDGTTKLLIWGIMSDAQGQLVVTLRDFRPHVGELHARGRADLAAVLAQDYLDDYAAGVGALLRRIQRVLTYDTG